MKAATLARPWDMDMRLASGGHCTQARPRAIRLSMTVRETFYSAAARLFVDRIDKLLVTDASFVHDVLVHFCANVIHVASSSPQVVAQNRDISMLFAKDKAGKGVTIRAAFGVLVELVAARRLSDAVECGQRLAATFANDFGARMFDALSPEGLVRLGNIAIPRMGDIPAGDAKAELANDLEYHCTGTLIAADPGADEDDQAALHVFVEQKRPFDLVIMPPGTITAWEKFMKDQNYTGEQRALITMLPLLKSARTDDASAISQIPPGIVLTPSDMLVIAKHVGPIANAHAELLTRCRLVSYQGNQPYRMASKLPILIGLPDDLVAFNDTGNAILFDKIAARLPPIPVNCATTKECRLDANIFTNQLMDCMSFSDAARDTVIRGSYDQLVGRANPEHVSFAQSLVNVTDGGRKGSNYHVVKAALASIRSNGDAEATEIEFAVNSAWVTSGESPEKMLTSLTERGWMSHAMEAAILDYCHKLQKLLTKVLQEDTKEAEQRRKAMERTDINTWYPSTIKDLAVVELMIKKLIQMEPIRDGKLWYSSPPGTPPATPGYNSASFDAYVKADKFAPAYDYVAAFRHLSLIQQPEQLALKEWEEPPKDPVARSERPYTLNV